MSGEPVEKKTRPQSTFSRALERLSQPATLATIPQKAKKTVGTEEVYICTSTGEDDTNTLFFIVDKSELTEGESFIKLGSKLEKLLGHPDWRIVGKKDEAPEQFARMYRNLTLLSPANIKNVEEFIPLAENPSHKILKQ